MKFSTVAATFAALATVSAQRPTNSSICDYYTTALLMENTAENQYTLLKLLVNTVVIGNYTKMPAPMNAVPGILAPGMVNGTAVNLLPFFSGMSGPTTNRGGVAKSGVNFLDGGGAVPLMNNSLPTAGSNEFTLLTHLYEYFGYLLGCSMQGNTMFPAYEGQVSQYEVHKFMYLTHAQTTYFINQVALAAESFGVASADVAVVGKALNGLFNVRCGPSTAVPATAMAEPQSICISSDCPLAANYSCAAYAQNMTGSSTAAGPNGTVVGAGNTGANATGAAGAKTSGTSSGSSSGSSGSASGGTGAADTLAIGSVVAAAAVLAALF